MWKIFATGSFLKHSQIATEGVWRLPQYFPQANLRPISSGLPSENILGGFRLLPWQTVSILGNLFHTTLQLDPDFVPEYSETAVLYNYMHSISNVASVPLLTEALPSSLPEECSGEVPGPGEWPAWLGQGSGGRLGWGCQGWNPSQTGNIGCISRIVDMMQILTCRKCSITGMCIKHTAREIRPRKRTARNLGQVKRPTWKSLLSLNPSGAKGSKNAWLESVIVKVRVKLQPSSSIKLRSWYNWIFITF